MKDLIEKTNVVWGQKLSAGDKTLYPIIEVSLISVEEQSIYFGSALPIAMLVVESNEQYIIPLVRDFATLQERSDGRQSQWSSVPETN